MNGQADYSDQKMASWAWWYYRRERNSLFPMSKGGLDSPLTPAEQQMVWDRVAFLMADRFPGEDEARLTDVLGRVRSLSLDDLRPIPVSTGRSIADVAASASRNARLANRRRRR